jgi:anti-sigma B factor antagonist
MTSFKVVETLLPEGRAVLALNGRLNALTAPDLKVQMKRLIAEGYTNLIIDFSDVPFVDSSGLAAMVSGLKTARQEEGTLKLAGLNEQTMTVFKLTLLDRVFDFYPDADAAVASLEG